MSEIALDEGTVPGTNFDTEVNAPVNVPNAQTSLADQGNGSLPASIETVSYTHLTLPTKRIV